MKNIPTAEEFLNQEEYYSVVNDFDTHQAMIAFAKLHIEAALQAAFENADLEHYGDEVCFNKDSILNAYPLTNIK